MWKVLNSNEIFKTPFFRLKSDKCELGDGRIMPAYFTMEFSDWAMIVPVTSQGQVVMVEQYRHSRQERFIEFPGGTTQPGANEDPEKAAVRELLEETGYAAGRVETLGFHCPNPALQNNRTHAFLAFDCERVSEPQLDPYEELEVKLLSVDELETAARAGQLQHSLMLATLFLALPKIKKIRKN